MPRDEVRRLLREWSDPASEGFGTEAHKALRDRLRRLDEEEAGSHSSAGWTLADLVNERARRERSATARAVASVFSEQLARWALYSVQREREPLQ